MVCNNGLLMPCPSCYIREDGHKQSSAIWRSPSKTRLKIAQVCSEVKTGGPADTSKLLTDGKYVVVPEPIDANKIFTAVYQ